MMKVYISVDIEGITGTTYWKECEQGNLQYEQPVLQMTKEALAAVQGALDAGADEILLRDAHNSAANIDMSVFPEQVRIIRGWSGDPYGMVERIDSTFDAVFFVGYHSPAGGDGNPLSHTMSTKPYHITINGVETSEFIMFSYAAASVGVPTTFLSGDEKLCEMGKDIHPGLHTVGVKKGFGGTTENLSPEWSLKLIREQAAASLRQDLPAAKIKLPKHFDVKIVFRSHLDAYRKQFYPGMTMEDPHTLRFNTDVYYEVLRMLEFVIL
jgi:D-amino peptidase